MKKEEWKSIQTIYKSLDLTHLFEVLKVGYIAFLSSMTNYVGNRNKLSVDTHRSEWAGYE